MNRQAPRRLLVAPRELAGWLATRAPLVFDCRFSLMDPEAGRSEWLAGHIPGAVHADLNLDLSGPVTAHTGRHPLPTAEAFAEFLARCGWEPGRQVVAYDAQSGAFAARLWWLLRHFGHDGAVLLDGGWAAWRSAGLPVEQGEFVPVPSRPVRLAADSTDHLGVAAVQAALANDSLVLLDARDAPRFAGEVEPIDPVAGHVPGARNHPFSGSLAADGSFRPAAALADAFTQTLGGRAAAEVVHMCGSGVTACHSLFAMELAGLGGSRLYPGSWSEWIRDPSRPVATGNS